MIGLQLKDHRYKLKLNMSFLKNLFGLGDSRERLTLRDADLGTFTGLNSPGNRIIWKGLAQFMNVDVTLFIPGEKDKLDDSQKASVLAILSDEKSIEAEVDQSLKEQYDNADKEYSNWRTHFKCISISSSEHDVTITMEEKESFYQFNIQFVGSKATGVSIDS